MKKLELFDSIDIVQLALEDIRRFINENKIDPVVKELKSKVEVKSNPKEVTKHFKIKDK